jgi:nitroreductase
MTDVYDAIKARSSIRHYKDLPVEEEKLEKILEAGIRAPTASALENWHFTVVRGEKSDRLHELIKEGHLRYYASRGYPEEKVAKLKEKMDSGMYRAPVYIVAFVDPRKTVLKDRKVERDYAIESVSAALQNMMIEARALGLGTCWIGVVVFVGEEIKRLLNRENLEVVATLSVGYPAEDWKVRERKPLKEVVEFV